MEKKKKSIIPLKSLNTRVNESHLKGNEWILSHFQFFISPVVYFPMFTSCVLQFIFERYVDVSSCVSPHTSCWFLLHAPSLWNLLVCWFVPFVSVLYVVSCCFQRNTMNPSYLYFINFHRTCSGKHMSIWSCYMNICCTIDICFLKIHVMKWY